MDVGGTIYNTHTLKPFKELALDSQRVNKLASKLHVHPANFAAKIVHNRRALSGTVINSNQEVLPFLLMLGLHTLSNISNSLLRMISDYMPGYLLAIRH